MPYRKSYKPKRYRRKRRGLQQGRRRPNISRSLSSPIPDRMFTTLKYSTLSTMNYAGGLTAIRFRGNSLFDPDFSGVGHQPYGFDQWANFYNRYRVYGVSYRITPTNTSTIYQGEVLVQHRPNSVLSASIEEANEGPYSQLKALPVEGAGRPPTFRGYHSVAKVYGVSRKQVRSEQDFGALISDNPPVNTFINIYLQNQSVVQALTATVRIELTYYAEFYERKRLAQS